MLAATMTLFPIESMEYPACLPRTEKDNALHIFFLKAIQQPNRLKGPLWGSWLLRGNGLAHRPPIAGPLSAGGTRGPALLGIG